MSVLNDLQSLPPDSRKFLVFTGFNLVSWQCIVGTVLVLFSRALGMPSSWVGTLLSFLPLSMLLVIFSIPAVETYGPRKLLIVTWLMRNIVASFILTIPLAIYLWDIEISWYILLFSILCFSLVRAFGVGAWFPWLHELVPKNRMGAFFSVETILAQVLTVLVTFGLAVILTINNGLERFYWIYGIGITAGLLSVWFARYIPGGISHSLNTDPSEKFLVLRHALRDKKYLQFIMLIILSISAIAWINVSSILYLRDVLGYSDSKIMNLVTVGAIGVALAVQFSSKILESFRSKVILSFLMALQMLISICWCLISPDIKSTLFYTLPLIVFGAIINAGFIIVASQMMMGMAPNQDRVGYTSLWITGTSISNGIPPILSGWLIRLFQMPGYRTCFLLAAGSATIVAILWSRFRWDEEEKILNIHHIVKPHQPLRTLQRITWLVRSRKKNNSHKRH
ncbi:MFS transporter [bacterium]|nr:MFS transporter [bacterium]